MWTIRVERRRRHRLGFAIRLEGKAPIPCTAIGAVVRNMARGEHSAGPAHSRTKVPYQQCRGYFCDLC